MDTKLNASHLMRESLWYLLRSLEVVGRDRFLTSILLVSRDGERLRTFVAPGLSETYCAAIDGSRIGPDAGSCGAAAFLGHEVFATDIARDPNWEAYREAALAHDLRSCWSTPVMNGAGEVVATFAIYHREPRSPTTAEVESIRLAAMGLLPLLEGVSAAPQAAPA